MICRSCKYLCPWVRPVSEHIPLVQQEKFGENLFEKARLSNECKHHSELRDSYARM